MSRRPRQRLKLGATGGAGTLGAEDAEDEDEGKGLRVAIVVAVVAGASASTGTDIDDCGEDARLGVLPL